MRSISGFLPGELSFGRDIVRGIATVFYDRSIADNAVVLSNLRGPAIIVQ
jgi:hypothetical protein